MYRFEKLEVWKMAINYSIEIYKATDGFPKTEIFGLSSQLRRAAISVSSNIAEGSGSSTKKDFCNFLDISIKSTLETVSQLILAKELGYLRNDQYQKLYQDSELLIKRIRGLKKYLKNSHPSTAILHPPPSNPQPNKEVLQ